MVFGVILAGGIGSRMGNVEKPKQYLSVGGKPIILHTLEKFYVNSKFEKLIVLCPSQWINHTKNLVKYCGFSPNEIRRVVAELYEVFDFRSLEEAQQHFEESPY